MCVCSGTVVFWPIALDKSVIVSTLPAGVSLVRVTYDYSLDQTMGLFKLANGEYAVECFNAARPLLPTNPTIVPVCARADYLFWNASGASPAG